MHPRLIQSIKKYRWKIFLGVSAAIFSTFLNVLPAHYIKNLIEQMENKSLTEYDFYFNIIGWVVCVILSAISLFYQRLLVISASRQIEYDLRNDFIQLLQRQSKEFFHKHPSGDLISNFTNDMERIRDLMGPSILHGVRGFFLLGFTITYMFFINFELTTYIVLPILIVPIVTPLVLKFMRNIYKIIQDQLSVLTQVTHESLSGISILKNYSAEPWLREKFNREAEKLKNVNLKAVKIVGLEWPILEFVAGMCIVFLFLASAFVAKNGNISLSHVIPISMLLFKLRMPMIIIGWVVAMIQRGLSASQRFFSIYDEMKNDQVMIENQNSGTLDIQEIQLKGLSFQFPDQNEKALQNINLSIKKGQTIGLVGQIGSGKTTLINILCGIYPVQKNMLFLNGKESNEIDAILKIKSTSLVPQDNFLFSDTIKNNIDLGDPKLKKNTEHYGIIAGLESDIQGFREGYESVLGEKGINLSGGQKQRVCIARGLASEASVLIFDDAFSSLDAKTENLLLENLNKYQKDKIFVIASHRLSVLKNADLIIVLENGEIKEQGDHETLINLKGQYAQIWRDQTLQKEIES